MTDLSPIAGRLAKLIPLLGSDQPGEVTAAAAAIGRLLNSIGATWHDLAEAMAPPPPRSAHAPPRPAWPPPPQPRSRTYRARRLFDPKLIWQGIDVILDIDANLTPSERSRLTTIRQRLYTRPDRGVSSDEERWLTTRWCWNIEEAAA